MRRPTGTPVRFRGASRGDQGSSGLGSGGQRSAGRPLVGGCPGPGWWNTLEHHVHQHSPDHRGTRGTRTGGNQQHDPAGCRGRLRSPWRHDDPAHAAPGTRAATDRPHISEPTAHLTPGGGGRGCHRGCRCCERGRSGDRSRCPCRAGCSAGRDPSRRFLGGIRPSFRALRGGGTRESPTPQGGVGGGVLLVQDSPVVEPAPSPSPAPTLN